MDLNKLYWLINTRSLLGKRRENNRGRIGVHEFTIPHVESDNNTAFTYGGHPLRLFGQSPLAVIVEAPGHWHLRDSSGFEIDPDSEAFMEVDSSISVDGDNIGPHPTFWLHRL